MYRSSDASHGTVASINVSSGGVPKRSRQSAFLSTTGVEGDSQRNLRYHGGPDRAVCLYSLELIEALRAEGHPIAPGTIGENVTISGVPWTPMQPGTRIEVGEVLLGLTSFAHPCRNIVESFSGGDILRVSQKRHPGWSRVYARVLHEGRIAVGDRVTLEAPAGSIARAGSP